VTSPAGPGPAGGTDPDPGPPATPGRALIRASWAGTAVFTALAVGAAAAPDALAPVSAVVDLALFAAGFLAFCWSLLRAADRSRDEELSVAGLWFLAGGSAPRAVQRDLLLPLGLQVVVGVATAAVRPFTPLAFGILVPLYGLGLAGVWGAAFGTFGPRRDADPRGPGPPRPQDPARPPGGTARQQGGPAGPPDGTVTDRSHRRGR
jgi:hypothetical protein